MWLIGGEWDFFFGGGGRVQHPAPMCSSAQARDLEHLIGAKRLWL